jgi:hypothetical protein
MVCPKVNFRHRVLERSVEDCFIALLSTQRMTL